VNGGLLASIDRAGPPGRLFVVVLGFWLVLALVPSLGFAQDAVPTLVAGELVGGEPEAVYGDGIYELTPSFRSESCTYLHSDQDCDDVAVAFLSAPLALPLAGVVSWLPDDVGLVVLRVVTAVAYVCGMLVVWRRLAERHAQMPRLLFFTALAFTPFVVVSVVLGTSSGLLFASACLGLAGTDRLRRAAGVGGLWAINVAFRGFPAVLAGVLVWRRRWLVLGAGAVSGALLTVLWLAIAPASLLGDFLHSTGSVASEAPANVYNGSLDAVLHRLLGATADEPTDVVSLVVRVLLLAASVLALSRLRAADAQWAYASLVALLLLPLMWAHYLGIAVAAYAAALVERDEGRVPGEGPAAVLGRGTLGPAIGLPITALAVSLAVAASGTGTGPALLRFSVLLAALVAVPMAAGVVGRRRSPAVPRAESI
jgi:hypothetical protein